MKCSTCIDNVRFVCNNREELIAVCKEFESRCKMVSAQLNDTHLSAEDRVCSHDTFLGETYDYITKTRCIGAKTVAKCRIATDVLMNQQWMSFRQFAAVITLTCYGAEVLRVSLLSSYDMMHQYERMMSLTAQFEDLGS